MRRYQAYDRPDEEPLEDGDAFFVGVNETDPPAQLEPGVVSAARNCRFTDGVAEPRLGVAKLPWSNRVDVGGVARPSPYQSIWGAGVFRDPDDVEWLIVAADGQIYRTRPGAGMVALPLPPGELVDYPVRFTQTYNGMICFRGSTRDEWQLRDLSEGFIPVQEAASSFIGDENDVTGSLPIPAADNGEWVGNRLFIPHEDGVEKDLLGISDYGNATLYKPVRSQARINQGSSDRLLRFVKFNEEAGLCLKEQSVYALYNLRYDLSEMILDEVTSEFGCCAPYAVVAVGKDALESASQLWFLSAQRGISSVSYNQYGRLQAGAVPVSRNMRRTIARINWAQASLARAAWWDNKVYFAVPLDEARVYVPQVTETTTYIGTSFQEYVIPEVRYRFTLGANETHLVNGSETLYESGEFVAEEHYVRIHGGPPGQAVTSSLERVYEQTNNAILVYDFLTGRWAGYDDGPAMCVKEFFTLTYQGQPRLFFISADGFINLTEELYHDEVARLYPPASGWAVPGASYDGVGRYELSVVPGAFYLYYLGANDTGLINGDTTLTDAFGSFVAQSGVITLLGTPSAAITLNYLEFEWRLTPTWIDYDWTSRGYTCGRLARKRFTAGRAMLSTYYPKYSIYGRTDGVNEEFALESDVTKSRTAYDKPFSAVDWDETNVNDDHATPWRQDYSIVLSEDTTPSGQIAAGTTYYLENLDDSAGIIYNSQYLAGPTTFVGVSGQTDYTNPESSLVAYWKLEEASGTREDSKGSNDLSPVNSPTSAAGKLGQALACAAGPQYLQMASTADLVMGDIDFTVAGWFYFDDLSSSSPVLVGKGYPTDASNEWCLAVFGTPKHFGFVTNNGANKVEVTSVEEPQTGTWYFVVAWHDAAADKIYLQVNNGTPTENDQPNGVPTGTRVVNIGGTNSGLALLGLADNVQVWKRLLSSGERAALYNAGAGVVTGLGGTPAVYGPGSYVYFGPNGLELDLHQEFPQSIPLSGREQGKYLQLRVTNNQGRCRVHSIDLEAQATDRRKGRHT